MATNGKSAASGLSATSSMMRVSDVAAEPLETLAPIRGYENMPVVSLEAAVVPLMVIVPDVNRSVDQAKYKWSQEPLPEGLTIDEAASITLYTMQGSTYNNSLYKILNAVLRSKKREELPSWFLYLKLLFTGLSRLQSSPQHVFRGVKPDLHEKYVKNTSITWWGFSSCTLEVDQLEQFLGKTGARTMFIIKCQSGKGISSFSDYPNEKEILLLPETQFKVIASLDQGNGLYTIQLEEIRSPLSISLPVTATNSGNTPSSSK